MTATTDLHDVDAAAELPEPVGVLEQVFQEGFMRGDPSVVDRLFSPDLVEWQLGLSGGTSAESLDRVRRAIEDVHRMIPDSRAVLADWAVRSDTAWCRFEVSGTNLGEFFGPPSGRPVRFTVIDVARVVEGRIVEHWGVPDRFAMLVQTGRLEALKSS